MDAKALLGLAGRNVNRDKARSFLSLAAIAAGVTGLVLSGGFVHDLIVQLGEAVIHSQSGHIQVARTGYFDFGSRAPGKYLMTDEEVERLAVAQVPHVREAMRRIAFTGLLGNGRSSYPIAGEGIEADREARLGTYMLLEQGRMLTGNDRYGALVGAGVARAMDLKPGSTINLVAPTVDEAMNTLEFEVVGIFQSFSKDYDDRVIKIPLGAAQELLNSKGANVVVAYLDDTQNTAAVAERLRAKSKGLAVEVRTWESLNDFYAKTVALYERQFGVLRVIVLLMVLLAVAGATNVRVLERAGEFGTMRALGNRGKDVMALVILEGAFLGTAGALIGTAIAAVAAWAISSVGIPMPPPPNSNLEFVARIRLLPSGVIGAFATGLLATVLASVSPGIRVARLPIVEALRRLV
jgi:putative ABC transport system permease protein